MNPCQAPSPQGPLAHSRDRGKAGTSKHRTRCPVRVPQGHDSLPGEWTRTLQNGPGRSSTSRQTRYGRRSLPSSDGGCPRLMLSRNFPSIPAQAPFPPPGCPPCHWSKAAPSWNWPRSWLALPAAKPRSGSSFSFACNTKEPSRSGRLVVIFAHKSFIDWK